MREKTRHFPCALVSFESTFDSVLISIETKEKEISFLKKLWSFFGGGGGGKE